MLKEHDIPKFWSPDGNAVPINYLLFDLDNTLYPASSTLAHEMHQRMTAFVARHQDISLEAAQKRRDAGFHQHGTTLRWLQIEAGLDDANLFLDYVHPVNLGEYLKPQPALRDLLESLEVPKVILTNAPRAHAERVLDFFGVESCFEQIFDLQWNGYVGKPHRSAYEKCLSRLGIAANQAVFIDDVPDYLATYHAMGGNCVLVDELGRHSGTMPGNRHAWAVVQSIFELPTLIHQENTGENNVQFY